MSRKSNVWLHFTQNSKGAVCEICKSQYSYKGGSTSNLLKHLLAKHHSQIIHDSETAYDSPSVVAIAGPSSSSSLPPPMQPAPVHVPITRYFNLVDSETNSTSSTTAVDCDVQESSTNAVSQMASEERAEPPVRKRQCNISSFVVRPMDVTRKKMLDEMLLKMIVLDLQPLSVVENEGFRAYTAALNPAYTIPSRSVITRSLLTRKYESVSEKLVMLLADVDHITITTDMWTSRQTESYISVTAHFITKDWHLRTALLDCCKFVGPHTSQELRLAVLGICQRWGVADKIHAIVTDNAANAKAAVSLLGWPSLPCLAHTLNLVVKDAIGVLKETRLKVKALVEFFHRSTSAADRFREMQSGMSRQTRNDGSAIENAGALIDVDAEDEQLQGSVVDRAGLKLINDVETRWNSTLAMFRRICLLEEPLLATLSVMRSKNSNVPATPEATEFSLMREVCEILLPFENITVELSAEKNVSGSKVLIMVRQLMQTMRKFSTANSRSEEAKMLATELLKSISERFPLVEHNLLLSLATFLDPRFKKYGINETSAKQKCKAEIERLLSEMARCEIYERTEPAEAGIETMDPIWGNFDRVNSANILRGTPTSAAIIELRQYSEELSIDRHCDPLDWWRKREVLYPRIAKLARKCLCLVATSVPSERVFSKAGELISVKRNRLTGDNVQKILFLNGNNELF